jgi:hypothetical protein
VTRGLEDALGLPHLDDILKEEGVLKREKTIYEDEVENSADTPEMAKTLDIAEKSLSLIEGKDHGDAMDDISDRALKMYEDMVDMGWNVDPARQSRTFEVAGQFLRMAKDAKDSKRDAQLKAMQLALNQKKLELDRAIAGPEGSIPGAINAQAIVHEDRNELIKQLRAQALSKKD